MLTVLCVYVFLSVCENGMGGVRMLVTINILWFFQHVRWDGLANVWFHMKIKFIKRKRISGIHISCECLWTESAVRWVETWCCSTHTSTRTRTCSRVQVSTLVPVPVLMIWYSYPYAWWGTRIHSRTHDKIFFGLVLMTWYPYPYPYSWSFTHTHCPKIKCTQLQRHFYVLLYHVF